LRGGTEFVEQGSGEEHDVAAELREDLASTVDGPAAVHVLAEMRSADVEAALPAEGGEQEGVGVGVAQELGRVEFLVVAAVAAFDERVVRGSALADAEQGGAERGEDPAVEAGQLAWALAAEFLAPVGLEADAVMQAVHPDPAGDQDHEEQAVGQCSLVGVGEEAQSGAHAAGRPLVQRKSGAFVVDVDVVGERLAIADDREVGLEEGEGLLVVPLVDAAAGAAPGPALLGTDGVAAEDVANRTGGKRDFGIAMQSQRAVAGLPASGDDELLERGAGPVGGVVGATAEISQAVDAGGVEAPDRLADGLAVGFEEHGDGAEGAERLEGFE
jgi:hypothetical protein